MGDHQTSAVPISQLDPFNYLYLMSCPTPSDPTIVWGTEVAVSGIEEFVRNLRSSRETYVTSTHVLVRSVGYSLAKHPHVNAHVVGRKVVRLPSFNILLPMQDQKAEYTRLVLIEDVDRIDVSEIASRVWSHLLTSDRADNPKLFAPLPQRPLAIWSQLHSFCVRIVLRFANRYGWRFRKEDRRLNKAATIINHFNDRRLPTILTYKPSQFPSNGQTLNITFGRAVPRPVVEGDRVVVRCGSPLLVDS